MLRPAITSIGLKEPTADYFTQSNYSSNLFRSLLQCLWAVNLFYIK